MHLKYCKQSDEEKVNACCLIALCKKNGSQVTKGTHLQWHAGFTLGKNVQLLCLSGWYLGGLFLLSPMKGAGGTQTVNLFFCSEHQQSSPSYFAGKRLSFLPHSLYISETQVCICHPSAWEFWVVPYISQVPDVLKSFHGIWRQKGTDS